MNKINENSGFVALTAVLVISFLVLTVATSISVLGVGEAKSSYDYRRGQEVLKMAEGCVEESLLRIRNDSSYTGTLSPLAIGNGTCTISVSGTGISRTVAVEAQLVEQRTYKKRLEATLSIVGNSVNINSWTEMN